MVESEQHPLKWIWTNMVGNRHFVPVCPQWLTFERFAADVGERPDGHKLVRLDKDGDWEPANVAWAKRGTNFMAQHQIQRALDELAGMDEDELEAFDAELTAARFKDPITAKRVYGEQAREELDKLIPEAIQSGQTAKEIAGTSGFSETSVYLHAKKLGFHFKRGRKPRNNHRES